jgi:hypothetical protein
VKVDNIQSFAKIFETGPRIRNTIKLFRTLNLWPLHLLLILKKNMKPKYIITIGLLTLVITSCNSGIDQKAKQNTSPPPAGLINLPATNGAIPVNFTDSNKPVISPKPAESANAALNPAHGQPGHRCEIAVGAPLSDAATNSITPGATSNNTPATIQPKNPITNNLQPQLTIPTPKATTRINPAHGQPGHKCDIAVGAPFQ